MKKESFSLCIILRNTLCTAFVLLVLLSAPTGWLYDLWAGEGTEQGQWPSVEVQRLRQQAGVHMHHNSGVKRSVSVSEYIYADYPIPPLQRFVQGFVGGYYNRYHLLKLEDGSWLCVYFDDYLALTGADNYPTGYVPSWESKLDAGCSAPACCMRGCDRDCVGYQKGF